MKKTFTEYKEKSYLPLELINDAIMSNYLDSLCYLLWIRKAYKRKPIIYKWQLRKVADKIKCSPTTAGHHIKILIDKGLLYAHNGNLCVVGSNKLRINYKSILVPVGIDKNKSNQIAYLRFAIIKRNLSTQIFKHNEKNAVLNFRKGLIHDQKLVRKLRRKSAKFPYTPLLESSIQNCLTLSNFKFGLLCKRSGSTGIKIQKKLNDLFLLKSIKRIKRINDTKMNRPGFFSLELNSSHFLSNSNYCMKRLSNELVCIGIEM